MRSLLLLFLTLSLCSAQEKPDTWRVQGSADGRFQVAGNNAEDVQNVLIWCSRSLEELEKQFRVGIPFDRGQTLSIILQPGLEAVHIRGHARSSQEILLPENEENGRVLAEAFVRVCLQRVLGKEAPEWLIVGFAPSLLTDETKRLFEESLMSGDWDRLPPPEALMHVASQVHPQRHVAALWLHRWLSRSDGPLRQNAPDFWRVIAAQPQPPVEQWMRWGQARDLRDLHIGWDLWRQGEQNTLMAELRIESLASARLDEWLRVRPAELGLDGGPPRYEPLSLPAVEAQLTEAWAADFLRQWMLRVQPLRFRQNEAFNQQVGAYLEAAALLLQAGERTGRNRQDALERFRYTWAEAEAMRAEVGSD
jgi:hypothetical protein